MMAKGVREFGPAQNAAFYAKWLCTHPTDPVLSSLPSLLFKNLDVCPFVGDWTDSYIPKIIYITSTGRYKRAGINASSDRLEVIVMGEMFAGNMAPERYMDHDTACLRFISAIQYYLENISERNELTTLTAQDWTQSLEALRALNLGEPPNTLPVAANLNDQSIAADRDGCLNLAMLFAYAMAMFATDWSHDLALRCFVQTHISICQMGNASTDFINDMRSAISIDLNAHIPIAIPTLSVFHKNFGSGITGTNLRECFRHWKTLIPRVPRMNLLVQQTAYAGLTIFITIGRAIKLFPDFNWQWVTNMYTRDVRNYIAAAGVVNGNPYYGNAKYLGVVKSTLYKNLGWVSFQLLLLGNCETSLQGFKGWPKSIPYQHQAMDKITQYLEARSAGPEEQSTTAGEENMVGRLINVVNSPEFANMFVL